MIDRHRAAIVKNLKAAEEQAERWRKTLAAYDAAVQSAFEPEQIRMKPARAAVMRANKRQKVGPAIREAINSIPEGQEFTLQDVFDRFPDEGFDYETSRPTISLRLSELAENDGPLKKLKRGKYVKVKMRVRVTT